MYETFCNERYNEHFTTTKNHIIKWIFCQAKNLPDNVGRFV